MSRRFDVSFVHTSPGRNGGQDFKNWYRVGVAHESDKGTITVRLRALPLPPADGEYVFILQEPKTNGPTGGGQAGGPNNGDDKGWL